MTLSIVIILLQLAAIAALLWIANQLKAIFREVRIPAVKKVTPEMKDRLKVVPRPGQEAARDERRDAGNRENREGGRRDERPQTEAPAAPVVEASATVVAAPAAAPASGRRPLPTVNANGTANVQASAAAPSEALPSVSLAQPAPEAPIRHGRRTLPKAKPNLDDVSLDEEKETTSN